MQAYLLLSNNVLVQPGIVNCINLSKIDAKALEKVDVIELDLTGNTKMSSSDELALFNSMNYVESATLTNLEEVSPRSFPKPMYNVKRLQLGGKQLKTIQSRSFA